MANHVWTNAHFHRISDEGKKKLFELYSRFEDLDVEGSYEYPLEQIFGVPKDEDPESTDGPGWYSWNTEHMGAKWAYVQDPDEIGFSINSAWSVPEKALDYIFGEVYKVDKNVVAGIIYEDEFPNFVGWQTWRNGDWEDSEYIEWDDILNHLLDNNEELREQFDYEEQSFTEEGNEILWEVQSDTIQELTWEVMANQFLIYDNEKKNNS